MNRRWRHHNPSRVDTGWRSSDLCRFSSHRSPGAVNQRGERLTTPRNGKSGSGANVARGSHKETQSAQGARLMVCAGPWWTLPPCMSVSCSARLLVVCCSSCSAVAFVIMWFFCSFALRCSSSLLGCSQSFTSPFLHRSWFVGLCVHSSSSLSSCLGNSLISSADWLLCLRDSGSYIGVCVEYVLCLFTVCVVCLFLYLSFFSEDLREFQ